MTRAVEPLLETIVPMDVINYLFRARPVTLTLRGWSPRKHWENHMKAIGSFLSLVAGLFLATATSFALAKSSPNQDSMTSSCKPPSGGGGPIKYEW